MNPRFDGYYGSPLLRHEDWHAGVHMVEEYYRFLKFFERGTWLTKDHPKRNLDFPRYLNGVTDQDFTLGWAGRHPYDANMDFAHLTGRFTPTQDGVALLWRHDACGEVREFHWPFRVDKPDRIASESGHVYTFYPTATPARGL
ncbi:MAG: hypothetical protein U0804_22705 [Gemmataceae bacterium]